jgi:site-specific DNA-methyltransferase (adenine-specific)
VLPKPYYENELGRLYHASCEDILSDIEPCSLLLTDPPYGLGKRLHDGGTWGTADKYDAMLEWDSIVDLNCLQLAINKAINSIIWGGNLYALPTSRCWYAWFKQNNVPTMADFELAWTNFDKPSKACRGIIHPDGVNQHPTQKPVYLMQWCLLQSKITGNVLDCFLGSGSTAIACERLKLNWIGIEKELKYVEIAVKRIEAERKQLKLF